MINKHFKNVNTTTILQALYYLNAYPNDTSRMTNTQLKNTPDLSIS